MTRAAGTAQPLNFHAGRCALWLAASRRRYQDIVNLGEIAGIDDGLQFIGDALVGLLALEQGLLAARWFLANSPEALADLPTDAALVDQAWARVRPLRSEIVAHMDSWILTKEPSLKVDSRGFWVGGDLVFTFDEWLYWTRLLEPWARRWAEQDMRPAAGMPTRPAPVGLAKLRK